MGQVDLSGYVEVNERIVAFHQQYPDGSLQSRWDAVEVAGQPLIVCEARAYRTPDDKRPGVGTASEPFPGKTPYTKDSELMNAETSAWGRALAALGFEVKRGIASREEVRNRQENGDGQTPEPPSTAQKSKITQLLNKNVAMTHHADLKAQAMTKQDATQLISRLIKLDSGEVDVNKLLSTYNITPASDVPVDTEGLPEAP